MRLSVFQKNCSGITLMMAMSSTSCKRTRTAINRKSPKSLRKGVNTVLTSDIREIINEALAYCKMPERSLIYVKLGNAKTLWAVHGASMTKEGDVVLCINPVPRSKEEEEYGQ
jgi:hypothetical protein